MPVPRSGKVARKREFGAVVQSVRMPACHAGGREFESRPLRKRPGTFQVFSFMAHFVYIIQSQSDGSYYVGETHDVELRVQRHNEGWSRSTKAKRPWTVVHTEQYASRTEALRREREIKGWKSRTRIEELIR